MVKLYIWNDFNNRLNKINRDSFHTYGLIWKRRCFPETFTIIINYEYTTRTISYWYHLGTRRESDMRVHAKGDLGQSCLQQIGFNSELKND